MLRKYGGKDGVDEYSGYNTLPGIFRCALFKIYIGLGCAVNPVRLMRNRACSAGLGAGVSD